MSLTILNVLLLISQTLLVGGMLLATWRIVRGPRAQDRVLGLDTLYVTGMLLALVFGMRTGSGMYFYASLIMGMIGFTSTVALAKFLMRGEVIE